MTVASTAVLVCAEAASAQGPKAGPPPAESEEGSTGESGKAAPAVDDQKKLDGEALPLIRRGVATGATVALQLPTPWNAAASVERVAGSALVYVGIFPGYLYAHDQDEVNAYCTTKQRTADRERAERIAIRRALGKDIPLAEIMTPEHAHDRATVAEKTGWHVGVDPSCGFWRSVGFITAVPTGYWTDVERHGRTQNTEVHPIIGLGIVVAPLPWLHIIGGITLSNAATGDLGAQQNHLAPSPFIGLAVPLDMTARALR